MNEPRYSRERQPHSPDEGDAGIDRLIKLNQGTAPTEMQFDTMVERFRLDQLLATPEEENRADMYRTSDDHNPDFFQ